MLDAERVELVVGGFVVWIEEVCRKMAGLMNKDKVFVACIFHIFLISEVNMVQSF